MDDKPKVGDMVHLGSVLENVNWAIGPGDLTATGTFTIDALQGPPGPPGETVVVYSGTRAEPAVSFVVDGWEYSFASKQMAQKVMQKLISMTLEGELDDGTD
jgi:hypothetical protein